MQLDFFFLRLHKSCSSWTEKKSRIYGICDKKNHDAEEEKKNIEEKERKKKDDDFLDSKQKKDQNYDTQKKTFITTQLLLWPRSLSYYNIHP